MNERVTSGKDQRMQYVKIYAWSVWLVILCLGVQAYGTGIQHKPLKTGPKDNEGIENILQNLEPLDFVENLDIDLSDPGTWEPYITKEELKFLEASKEKVISRMMTLLVNSGSPLAALLLGHFKHFEALTTLRKLFIEKDHFYGWETSYPDPLHYLQFPSHHAYEQAIVNITQKPLEKFIVLTPEEVSKLRKRKDYSAVYVLFRLQPEVAKEIIFEQFRKNGDFYHPFECVVMIVEYNLLPIGLNQADVRKLMGEPTRHKESRWFYEGEGWMSPYRLTLVFKKNLLKKITLEEVQ